MISATRPTRPSVSRTLIPWGWNAEQVRISLTIPRVRLPLRWSVFWIMSTVRPARTSARCCDFLSCSWSEKCGYPDCCPAPAGDDGSGSCPKKLRGKDGASYMPMPSSRLSLCGCPPAFLATHHDADIGLEFIRLRPEYLPAVRTGKRRFDGYGCIRGCLVISIECCGVGETFRPG